VFIAGRFQFNPILTGCQIQHWAEATLIVPEAYKMSDHTLYPQTTTDRDQTTPMKLLRSQFTLETLVHLKGWNNGSFTLQESRIHQSFIKLI
jgi:hypothetical protein